MKTEFYCTRDNPWPWRSESLLRGGVSPSPLWVVHPDAVEVDEQQDGWLGGDIVTYECPHCGYRWRTELPQ